MPSTATSSPRSRSISRRARAAGPSSTACTRWRAPSATRSSPCPRASGRASPAGSPNARGRGAAAHAAARPAEGRSPFRPPPDRSAAPPAHRGGHPRRAGSRRSRRRRRAGHRAGPRRQQGLGPAGRCVGPPGVHRRCRLADPGAPARRRSTRRRTRAWRSSWWCPTGAATWSRRSCRGCEPTRPTSCGGSSDSRPVSLGLLGGAPSQAVFTMAGANRPSRLSITAEPSGGSVTPTAPIVATGTV